MVTGGIAVTQNSVETLLKLLGKARKETMRKLLKTKLYSRNLIKGINTWVVPLERYS